MDDDRGKKTAPPDGGPRRGTIFIIVLLGAVFCTSIVMFSFKEQELFRRSIVDRFQSHQRTIALGVSRGIENMIMRINSTLETVASSPQVRDIDSKECRDRIQEFYFANQDIVFAGYRMNRDGVLQYMYPLNESAIGADISYQGHVKRLLETGDLVVSGLFHAVEGFDAIAIHAPVYRQGKLDGSVAAVIEMSRITEIFIRRVHPSENGYCWLVDENGVILDHPEHSIIGEKFTGTELFSEDIRRNIESIIGHNEIASKRLGDTLFAFAPMKIGDRRWTVVLSTPYSDISEPVRMHWRNTLLANAAVFIVAILVGFTVIRAGTRAARLERENELLEDRLLLQEELRESRDQLDMIVRTIPSGLYTVDTKRKILSWNPTAERILGYTAGEVIGKTCDIFALEDCTGECFLFESDVPKPMNGCECRYRARDGRIILVSKNIDYIQDATGRAVGGIESFVDITDARLMEKQRINTIALEREVEQLKRLDEVKSNFLSMVSHELRTPLSVMLGNLGMAWKGKYGELPEKFKEKLGVVLKRGWQLNDLIANLLNLAKIESGKLDLQKEDVEVQQAVHDAVAELEDSIRKKSLEIVTAVSDSAKIVRADPSMFHRLLVNLAANAVKFTPDNGNIEISAEKAGDHTMITVRDTGIGIPDDALPHVFDRFYQVDDTSTRKYGGTGLGLAIVRQIVEVHRGFIEIKSREGEGTVVAMYFPLHDMEAERQDEAEPSGPAELPSPHFKGPRSFMYVGTDPDYLTSLVEMFEETSHRVFSVQDQQEAAVALDRDIVSAVIVDLDTGAPSDRELEVWQKVIVEDLGIPLATVSESQDEETLRKTALTGAAYLFEKPLDPDIFIRQMKNMLGE